MDGSPRIREVRLSISWDQKTFFGKGWIVNILDIVGHLIPVTTTQFCHVSEKSPKQKSYTLHRQYIS